MAQALLELLDFPFEFGSVLSLAISASLLVYTDALEVLSSLDHG